MESKEKKMMAQTSVKRVLQGEVVSDKMDKTIVVKVTRRFKHPLLGKIVNKAKKYKVHDEDGGARVGDLVEFCECRPLSKTKHMVLNRIIRKAS